MAKETPQVDRIERPEPPLPWKSFYWYTVGTPAKWAAGALLSGVLLLICTYVGDSKQEEHEPFYFIALALLFVGLYVLTLHLVLRNAFEQAKAIRANAATQEFKAAEELRKANKEIAGSRWVLRLKNGR
jgi:hypothetical protein